MRFRPTSAPRATHSSAMESINAETVKLAVVFVAWYVVSTAYSMFAKLAMELDRDASALLLSLLQFVAGVVSALAVSRGDWGEYRDLLRSGGPLLALIALAHFVGAYMTAVSMNFGPVAVTYIIKATEPLFAVALSLVMLGSRYSRTTLLTLVPLCVGLVLACYKSDASSSSASAASSLLSFGSAAALISNVGMGMRNVLTKLRMVLQSAPAPAVVAEDDLEALKAPAPAPAPAPRKSGPHVLFGVMSIYSTLYTLALIVFDAPSRSQLGSFLLTFTSSSAYQVLSLAGLCHALYTLCSFYVLSRLAAASHAISNSMKHVVVIGAATVFLGNSLSTTQALGAVLAIGGVFLYNKSVEGTDDKPSPTFRPPQSLNSWPFTLAAVGATLLASLLFVVLPSSTPAPALLHG